MRLQKLRCWGMNPWLIPCNSSTSLQLFYLNLEKNSYFFFVRLNEQCMHFFWHLDLYFCYRYLLTAVYLFAINYYTRIGGKVSAILIKCENNQGEESSAASLVYKVTLIYLRKKQKCFSVFLRVNMVFLQVFGLYFVQSYIGLFYHALLHRNISTLRQVLIQRLIVSQVCQGFFFFFSFFHGILMWSFTKLINWWVAQSIGTGKSDREFHPLSQVQL